MSSFSDKTRQDTARGFSALKIMLDERTGRLDHAVEDQRNDLSHLRERVAKLEAHFENIKTDVTNVRKDVREEVTGAHKQLPVEIAKMMGKEQAEKEARSEKQEERRLRAERWKASAPIFVATLTAGSGLLLGIINLILQLLSGGGGGH